MFVAAVTLLMFVCPALSVAVEVSVNNDHGALIDVVGKWFVFWAVGVRLFTAGMRQIARPGLTSEGILGIEGHAAWQLVRELGFANVAIGSIAVVSLWHPPGAKQPPSPAGSSCSSPA